jgi:hypothetical protein
MRIPHTNCMMEKFVRLFVYLVRLDIHEWLIQNIRFSYLRFVFRSFCLLQKNLDHAQFNIEKSCWVFYLIFFSFFDHYFSVDCRINHSRNELRLIFFHSEFFFLFYLDRQFTFSLVYRPLSTESVESHDLRIMLLVLW